MRLIICAFSVLLVLVPDLARSEPSRWSVELDYSSMETLLLHPERVLEDPEAFWESDGAYRAADSWHRSTGISRDRRGYYEGWLQWLEERAAMTEEARRSDPAIDVLDEIRSRESLFQSQSFPLLDSFLPENGLTFETTVHITTRTFPFAFMSSGQIVADPLSAHFNSDADRLLNLITHECFHVGYGFNRGLRTENPLTNGFVYDTMLDALQNEGMATWVGYNTRPIFPASDEPDYIMLEDRAEVQRHLDAVNDLFARALDMDPDELRDESWKTGVDGRGYYVLGAHMARTIEMTLGRKELRRTVAVGPLDFVDTYNRLAPADMQVHAFERDFGDPLVADLKAAVVADDRVAFDAVLADLAEHGGPHPQDTRRLLERFGYGMVRLGELDWALAVFEADTLLFPDHPNSWDCVAETCWRKGDATNAIRYYERALQVDPGWENATKMILEIQAASTSRSGRAERIGALMREHFENGTFNGAFLVADRQGLLIERAHGMADEEWQVAATPATRFRIGSLTKQFTASLIMRLVDEGRLDLDTRLSDVLPWYREDTGSQVTIRQLLNHTSGIDRRGVVTMIQDHGRTPIPLRVEVQRFCSGDLEWVPGADVGYNNGAYLILGAVIEEITGQTYAAFLSEAILDPLGMSDSGVDDGKRVIENYARGYDLEDGELRHPAFVHASLAASAGGAYSSVRDLYAWDRALYTDAVLSDASRQLMFTPGLGGAGFGWFIENLEVAGQLRTWIHHPGQGDGFWSALHRFPQDELLIVLINNHGRTDLDAMVTGILDIYYDDAAPAS